MFLMCRINPNLWHNVCKIQTKLGINKFVIKLVLFVQECYKQVDGIQVMDLNIKCFKRNAAWAQDLPIGIYYFIICYI